MKSRVRQLYVFNTTASLFFCISINVDIKINKDRGNSINKNDKKRYITKKINEEIDEELQSILWKMHELLEKNRKDKMDYFQVFNIFKMGDTLVIKNRQEKPIMNDKLMLKRNYLGLEQTTIWIIDNHDTKTMLFPSDY